MICFPGLKCSLPSSKSCPSFKTCFGPLALRSLPSPPPARLRIRRGFQSFTLAFNYAPVLPVPRLHVGDSGLPQWIVVGRARVFTSLFLGPAKGTRCSTTLSEELPSPRQLVSDSFHPRRISKETPL